MRLKFASTNFHFQSKWLQIFFNPFLSPLGAEIIPQINMNRLATVDRSITIADAWLVRSSNVDRNSHDWIFEWRSILRCFVRRSIFCVSLQRYTSQYIHVFVYLSICIPIRVIFLFIMIDISRIVEWKQNLDSSPFTLLVYITATCSLEWSIKYIATSNKFHTVMQKSN